MNVKLTGNFFLLLVILASIRCFSQQPENRLHQKILIDIGDSLTAGAGGEGVTMSNVTRELLGGEWIVKNRGVGGENTLTIGARQGGIPMYIKDSITIPADYRKSVKIPSGIFSSYNHENIKPLIQGDGGLNPCYIDGIECTLMRDTETEMYSVKRNKKSALPHTTKTNTTIITQLSLETNGVATIFIGQNGGYKDPEDLLKQINQFISHKGDENVIIITSHGNGKKEVVGPIINSYGNKVIDFKEYMANEAIYDAIKYGLLPNNGAYPTEADLKEMTKKKAPPSLLNDKIHLNKIGYELLGRLRYKKGKELGYW